MRKMETERLIKKTLNVGNQSKTVAIKWGAILQKNCLTSLPPEIESSVHYSPKTLEAGLPENVNPSLQKPFSNRLPEHSANRERLLPG